MPSNFMPNIGTVDGSTPGAGSGGSWAGVLGGLAGALGQGGGGSQDYKDSTSIDDEGLQHLLRVLLEGNSGLAEISSGEQRVGLYNSTVNQMLMNDLISRSAGEVAARTATSSRNYEGSGGGTLGGIGSLLGTGIGAYFGGAPGASVGGAIGGAVGGVVKGIKSLF